MGTKGMINRLTEAYNTANAALKDNQAQAATLYQPYTSAGTNALANLADPNKNFQASPDYQFRLNQGLNAVTQNKAVNGLLQSGSALKGINDYAGQSASQEFGNWWGRQAGLAGLGAGATGNLVNLGTQTASQIGQNAVGLASGINGIKQQAQAQTNSLWGSVLGAAAAFGTGGASLFTGFGGVGGGGAVSAANPGIGGYNVGWA